MQPVLIGIGAYLVVQFAVGMLVSRRIASESDYLLAGRRLGVTLAAFSIFATWFGAETVVGAAGSIYSDGLSGGSADPFGYALCLVVLGAVIAAPLWRRKYTTFGDLFRERYSPGVERLAVLLMVPTSVLWAAAQIRAFGQVVSVSSDIGVDIAITAAAAFVIIYTVAGGLLADVVTDFVQSIGIVIGLVILLVVVGEGHVEARLEVVGQRELAHRRERRVRARGRELYGRAAHPRRMRVRLGHAKAAPARVHQAVGLHLLPGARAPFPVREDPPPALAVVRDQLGERAELVERRGLADRDLLHDRSAGDLDPDVGAAPPARRVVA